MNRLPAGWIEGQLGEVADWGSGGTPKADMADYYGGSIPWAVIGDLNDGFVGATARTITDAGLSNSSAKMVDDRTVLVAMYGSIGKLGLPTIPMATNQAIAFARPRRGIVNRLYLFYYLMHARRALATAGKGATQQNISQAVLKAWPIPLAPATEQDRIVAAIEEQFSRLGAGVAALEHAHSRLSSLRNQSILALIQGTGARERLGEIAEIRLGRQRSPKTHSGPNMHPYLRAANVTWNGLDLKDVKQMNFSPTELSTYALEVGDVIVAEASGSASEVGRPAVWDGSIPNCCFQNTLIRLRSTRVTSDYLYFILLALARGGTFARASKGVGIHHLSKAGLAGIEVEVPSLSVQEALVDAMRSRQEHFEDLEVALAACSRRATHLRSAVLAAAFSGELVAPDASDEPAATLLEDILAERASSTAKSPVNLAPDAR